MNDCTLRHGEWASQVAPRDPGSAQKTAATCALGLAILSSICRSQHLAQSQAMIEKVPLFAKVGSFVPSRLKRGGLQQNWERNKPHSPIGRAAVWAGYSAEH